MAIKKKTDLADELGTTPEELEKAKRDPYEEDDPKAPVEIDIDFEVGSVQAYANGTYPARLEATEKKMSSKDNPMVVWRFRTIQDKRAFFLNTALTRDAMWKVTETAVACGASGEGQTRINLSELHGNPCRIVIENYKYEGEMRPGIKKVLTPDARTLELSDLD